MGTCRRKFSEVMTHPRSPTGPVHPKPSAKSGTWTGRKSALVDGRFIADLHALRYFARVDGSASSVVYPPVSLPSSDTPSNPKPWRDIGEGVRGLFFHTAMKAKPNLRGFTLKLSEATETTARGQGIHCLAWIHRRVVLHLRRAVKAPAGVCVPFWFAIEEDDRRSLHLHGEIEVDPFQKAAIRKALKGAGGKWAGHGRGTSQLRFEVNPDFRWAGYSLKGVANASPSRRRLMGRLGVSASATRFLSGFEGKAVTASQALKRDAIALHATVVAEVVALTKRPAFWGTF